MMRKILFVCINRSIKKIGQKDRKDLFDCTRKYWKLSPDKADKADVVVAVANGEVMAAFKNCSGWRKIGCWPDLQNDEEVKKNPNYSEKRYAFDGEEIPMSKKEKDKIKMDFPGFTGNPIRYNY
ncbi:MAG: hypothetical protein J5791_11440 [Fibrobacter sp.]|nr:hypothetical protein [Fibrobacter sp.]